MKNKYICPICGFNELIYKPNNSYEICPCCGYEFGSFEYNNEDLGKYFNNYKETEEVFDFIREIWLNQGAKWWSENKKKPKKMNFIKQLNNIQGFLFKHNKKGSSFGEFQYCHKNLPIKNLLDLKNIEFWKDNSLFVEYATCASDLFWEHYLPLLQYANIDENKIGFDDYGINYYTPKQTQELYNKIKINNNLPDRQILLDWLKIAIEKYNGFYFIGA